MQVFDTLIIGGGVAGLSTLWHLTSNARSDRGPVALLEREALCGSAASGRNAGIFRHVEHDPASTALAIRARRLLRELSNGRDLLRRVGALYLYADAEPARALAARAREWGVDASVETLAGMPKLRALFAGSRLQGAVLVPDDGVIDVHAMLESLRRGAIAAGALVRSGAMVERVLVEAGRVAGVILAGGEIVRARTVVIAAGAWSRELGQSAGSLLPLVALRRHLALLRMERPVDPSLPVLWRIDEPVYARAESGGLLVSPCDESPWPPMVSPPFDRDVLEELAGKLAGAMPPAVQSSVETLWACLRTFAPDRKPVVGLDPEVAGLSWLAGLGGQGMSTALAAGEVLAAVLEGRGHPLAEAFSPTRPCLREPL